MIEILSFFWSWFMAAGTLGFVVGAMTTSFPARVLAWLGIPLALTGLLATQSESFSVFLMNPAVAIFVGMAFASAGSGILIGANVPSSYTRFFFKSCLRAPEEEKEDSQYHGPRCVACRKPIAREETFCPRCGWTQPV
jgi:hypothetical protein